MTAIVLGLLKDDALRRRIGQAARDRAVSEFNRDRVVAQYLASYQRLVNGK
jgi:glycosyltransferase involved in cell wall biosynthesis